ncbi:hypothetical protein L7F22_021288 [Adiantum nelumboides]|nr:hypothetical protein [Adiantum nelumboides]
MWWEKNASQVFWLKKLIDLHKKETTPMLTHLNEFKTILSQLQAQEVEFQDFVKAMFLLVTLLDSWDTFHTAIDNLALENGLKCVGIESSLLMEELNCKNVDDSRSSNAMHVRGRQQSRGNGSSDRKKSKSKERSKSRSRKDVEGRHGIVRLGNSYACEIVGNGDIKMSLPNGSQFTLTNVRHVPKLIKSLISTGQLDDDGYHTIFGNQS